MVQLLYVKQVKGEPMRTSAFPVCLILFSFLAAPAASAPNEAKLQDFYAVDEGGKCGYINATGSYIIPAKYDRGHSFRKGLASVTLGYDTHFIDPSGKVVFSLPDRMRSFGFDERDDTAIIEARTGKGFVDLQGRVIAPPIFFELRPLGGELSEENPFHDHGTTTAQLVDQRFVVIDRSGEILFGPRAGRISILEDGVYAAWSPQEQADEYFDRGFRPLPRFRAPRYQSPQFSASKFGRVNVWHESGYAEAQLPKKEWNEGWGIINAKGEWVVRPIYNDLYFNEGANELTFIHARRGPKWGFIDISGKEVIPFTFDEVLPFVGNHAPAALGGEWGLIDKSGQWKLKPGYDGVQELSDSAVAVQQGHLWGVVDYDGRWLIEPRFRSVGFCQGRDFTLAEHMFEPEDSPRAREYEDLLGGVLRVLDQKEGKRK